MYLSHSRGLAVAVVRQTDDLFLKTDSDPVTALALTLDAALH